MQFDGSLRELGPLDHSELSSAILNMEESAWTEQQYRQKAYSVHEHTESLVLVFCQGWPDIQVSKEPAWDALHPYAVPIMHQLIAEHLSPGGTIIRAMAAKLKAGGVITPHRDTHQSFVNSHRIHIPITSNSGVRFMIDGRPHRLQPGQAYEINNQLNHSVMNRGKEDRITFIFDYLPASN